ncbi:DUF2634 domain-containing protein [Longirhabdus pacifica]|uniref:DUF2634 domain-containing protein n=1 Tax=Longirhabdus pacifica TaxID=2305227 RepID=UPI001008DE4D|nr:DUF2634 domain-containing protein [Longirhabdus pacifica]
MALSPIQVLTQQDQTEDSAIASPSKTYAFDFNTGEIKGFVEDVEALKQYIRKALVTPRLRYLIYSDQYGSELESLIGSYDSQPLIYAEVPRLIKDALIYDDRIIDVYDFQVEARIDDLFATFTVESIYGTLEQEVNI